MRTIIIALVLVAGCRHDRPPDDAIVVDFAPEDEREQDGYPYPILPPANF